MWALWPSWGLVSVYETWSRQEAQQRTLVLVAMDIRCRVVASAEGYAILVPQAEAERARHELYLFERENPPRPAPPDPRSASYGIDAALVVVCLLLFVAIADAKDLFGLSWKEAGAVQTAAIRAGEVWRSVTALFLHADIEHLMGNIGFGVLFGLLLSAELGAGLAWLAILSCGTLGNLVNALLHGPEHAAVGASTALFAALGLLSGRMWRLRVVPWRGGIRRWAPLGGGVLLLVFTGFGGERTDVGAHVAGFLTGVLGGWLTVAFRERLETGMRAQTIYAASACLMVALAWTAAVL